MRLQIQDVQISKLIGQARNPNRMSAEEKKALKASIEQHGFLQPILVKEQDGAFYITDGHHRTAAVTDLGWDTIPAVVVNHLTDRQVEMLQLAMNKNRGSLQLDIVEAILRDLVMEGISDEELLSTGYTDEDVARLLKTTAGPDMDNVKVEAAASMELPARPVSLEIPLQDAEQLRVVRDKLKKASGKASDVSIGLLHLLGMAE